MSRLQGMSMIGLLLSMVIIMIMLWMLLSSMKDEFGVSSGAQELLNLILPR